MKEKFKMSGKDNTKELKALIRLLEDPDEQVYATIRKQIITRGMPALPILEETESHLPASRIAKRLQEIIHTIRVNHTYDNLKAWKETNKQDLLEAWIIISTFLSPDENREKLEKSVDKLYRDIWVEMNQDLTALEKIKVINHVFYHVYQYDALQGKKPVLPPYLLGNVVRMQRGNPLSLAMLYLIITQRLEMPVFGVNLPQHLILAYTGDEKLLRLPGAYKEEDILFYINPFNKGAVFRKSEIELYLKQLNIKPEEKFFLPCENIEIVRRLLRELAAVSAKSPNRQRTKALNYFLTALGSSF